MAVAPCFTGVLCDASCRKGCRHRPGVGRNLEELIMRKELTFFLSILLAMGALIAPTAFAAEKSYFEANETFDPFGYYGTPVGYYLSFGTVKCPPIQSGAGCS